MSGPGIDYGMGRANIDVKTGFRYGVISQNSVSHAWSESAKPEYEPACPKCGRGAKAHDTVEVDTDSWASAKGECADFACEQCEYVFGSESAFGDEPAGWSYAGDGYQLIDCLDSDIMVLQSPVYTLGAYCSPCVPGAVNLESPLDDGAKAYCLDHDWFEDGAAPYPVYSVETGQLIPAPAK